MVWGESWVETTVELRGLEVACEVEGEKNAEETWDGELFSVILVIKVVALDILCWFGVLDPVLARKDPPGILCGYWFWLRGGTLEKLFSFSGIGILKSISLRSEFFWTSESFLCGWEKRKLYSQERKKEKKNLDPFLKKKKKKKLTGSVGEFKLIKFFSSSLISSVALSFAPSWEKEGRDSLLIMSSTCSIMESICSSIWAKEEDLERWLSESLSKWMEIVKLIWAYKKEKGWWKKRRYKKRKRKKPSDPREWESEASGTLVVSDKILI